jgi:DNA-binding transcriptional ArsR family regulator
MAKSFRQLERVVRGFSNHRRIQILDLLLASPDLDITEIAARLRLNFKTASEHVRRLAIAGLVSKRQKGASVQHKVLPRGEKVLMFLRTLE